MSREPNRRILAIDDQASILEDFRKILVGSSAAAASDARSAFLGEVAKAPEGPRFELRTADQGAKGVGLCQDALDEGRPFALAFVDVRMPPGMDGIQTIQELWKRDAELQVVICTAYSDYSFEEIVERLGSSDRLLILKKPFDPVEVRQLAGALTEKWNVARRDRERMEELQEANERAESASRAKSDFLANMSHEIRTPMNALLGYVDLVCDPETPDEERRRYASTIRQSGEHLLAVLNDILDISRIEASRLVVNAADFSPFDLAREVVGLMRPEAAAKDLSLELEVAGPLPEVVESDLVRVRQILLNLLGNAIKFTVEGGVRLVLRLDDNEEAEHRYLCFDVVDTGPGVAEEKLSEIFEPFSQADTSSTRRHGGTGLGLTIARRLALLLGGDLEVRTELGRGSTFTLRLYAGQLKPAALRSYSAAECAPESASVPEPQPAEPESLEARVLVVEDVKFNQLLLGALLRKVGASVQLADDGQEGHDKVLAAEREGRPFDLVLMDMQMPVLDGYEATRRLRAQGYRRPIVALTAHAMKGDRERCLEAGCSDYATKPLQRQELLRTCRRLLELETAEAPLPAREGEREGV